MNRKTKDNLWLTGCAIQLAIFAGAIFLGVFLDTRYFLVAGTVAALVITVVQISSMKQRKAENLIFEETLGNCPGGRPHYHRGISYAYSTYVITFGSGELMDQAIEEGRIEAFKQGLKSLHRGTGFRPSAAVGIYGIGRIIESTSTLANGKKLKHQFHVESVAKNGNPVFSSFRNPS